MGGVYTPESNLAGSTTWSRPADTPACEVKLRSVIAFPSATWERVSMRYRAPRRMKISSHSPSPLAEFIQFQPIFGVGSNMGVDKGVSLAAARGLRSRRGKRRFDSF